MSEKTSEIRELKTDARRLNEIGHGFGFSGVLKVALELDLFTGLSRESASIPDIARRVGITENGAEDLMTCCLALDLVERDGDLFKNTKETEKYMVKGKPSYFGDYLVDVFNKYYSMAGQITDILRGKVRSDIEGMYYSFSSDPKEARALTKAGYTGSLAMGRLLAKLYDFSQHSLLLDLGGGSGAYCIAAAHKYPDLKAIVFDFPLVTEVARELIEKEGLSDRISTYDGDFHKDTFPEGADVILNAGNMHAYGSDKAKQLFKKAFNALPSGGGMIVIDQMLNEDRSGPLIPALYALVQKFYSNESRTHSIAEVSDYFAKAGVQVEGSRELVPDQMWIVWARRP
jgi:hypothetical protein